MPFIGSGGGGVSGVSVALVFKRVVLVADGTSTLMVGEGFVANSLTVWEGGSLQYPTSNPSEWISEADPVTGELEFLSSPPANGTKLIAMYAKA